MKNLFLIILLSLSCLFSLFGCDDDIVGKVHIEYVKYKGRYVSYYGMPSGLNFVGLNLDTMIAITGFSEFDVSEHESSQYSFAKYFNDLNYEEKLPKNNRAPYHDTNMTCVVSGDSIKYINIVSDKDFDATHPAGTNLSDLFDFHSFSIESFIKSGYSVNIPEMKYRLVHKSFFEDGHIDDVFGRESLMYGANSERNFLYGVKLKANEVNNSNSKLLARSIAFTTKTKPVNGGIHNIKITIKYSNKELTKSIKLDLDKVYEKGMKLDLPEAKHFSRELC